MNNKIRYKIKLLRYIKPDQEWIKSQRRNLLLEILSDKKAKKTYSLSGFFISKFFRLTPKLVFKPVIVASLLIMMIFGGGFLTIKIAESSVPGDFLYPVKIVIEDIKVAFSSQQGKSKLQAQFVGHRIKELTQIINSEEALFDKTEQINKAVNKLESQVAISKIELSKAKKSEPKEIKKIAETVKQETFNSEEELRKTKKKLVEKYKEEESEETAQAIKIINRVLAVLLGEERGLEEEITETVKFEKEDKKPEEVKDVITFPRTVFPQNTSKSFNEPLNASESFNEPSEDFEFINQSK